MTLKLFTFQLLAYLKNDNRYINIGRNIFIMLVILTIGHIYF